MKWTPAAVALISERIAQLGLSSCPVCSGETLGMMHHPVVAHRGGIVGGATEDSGTGTVYLVAVECHLCGHVLLFNSDRFSTGDGSLIEREAPKSDA